MREGDPEENTWDATHEDDLTADDAFWNNDDEGAWDNSDEGDATVTEDVKNRKGNWR